MEEKKTILIAQDNRKNCSNCGGRINKGEKFFRDAMVSYRKSHTVNICEKCMVRFVSEIEVKRVEEIKKELILEKL